MANTAHRAGTPIYKKLGEALRKAREFQELSLRDAEVLTGIKRSNLSSYENGKRSLSLRTVERILAAYEMGCEIVLTENLE